MKTVWVAIALILLSTSSGFAQFTCPVQLKSVAPVDASYHRKYDTIAHQLLDDETVTGQVTPQMYAVLDAIVDQVRATLPPYPEHPTAAQAESYARQALPAIDCAMIEHGFVWTDDGVLLLSDGLRLTHADDPGKYKSANRVRNKLIEARLSHDYYAIDCDTGSYVYLAVADAMHLPLAAVFIPGHAFVRWVADPANPLDFETTDGTFVSPGISPNSNDAFYSQLFIGMHTTRNRRHELMDMSHDQILGLHHVMIAEALRFQQAGKAHPNYRPMLREYEAAIRYDPELDWPYNEIAWYHAVIRPEPETGARAYELAERAAELADEPAYRNTKACLRALQGDFVRARTAELAPSRLSDATESGVGERVLTHNADEIAHGMRCSETQADYTAWGPP